MDPKIAYLRNLIYLGRSDADFQEGEKAFIRKVGERLGLTSDTVEHELSAHLEEKPPIPSDEVLRFILLDDLIHLSTVDRQIREEEMAICEQFAVEMGYNPRVIQDIFQKIRAHLEGGFIENQVTRVIKEELFRLSNQNFLHEKYR